MNKNIAAINNEIAFTILTGFALKLLFRFSLLKLLMLISLSARPIKNNQPNTTNRTDTATKVI